TPPAAPSLPHPLPSTGGTPEDGGEAAEPPATAPAQPQPLAAAEHGAALHAAAQAHIAARQAVGNPAPASLPAAAQPLGLEVASPVGSSQWGQELGRQLVTISHDARQGHHTAELRLDPPDLGPLRVSINLHEGVASAAFVSVHAAVR
ncbi:flagellar hook-length control protein FliK, partial [Bordetella pertussis]